MAREDLARDSERESSLRSAGAPAGTVVRPDSTVVAATATGFLHGIVSVPAGVPTPARTPADVRSSTDSARLGIADVHGPGVQRVAAAGGHRVV